MSRIWKGLITKPAVTQVLSVFMVSRERQCDTVRQVPC